MVPTRSAARCRSAAARRRTWRGGSAGYSRQPDGRAALSAAASRRPYARQWSPATRRPSWTSSVRGVYSGGVTPAGILTLPLVASYPVTIERCRLAGDHRGPAVLYRTVARLFAVDVSRGGLDSAIFPSKAATSIGTAASSRNSARQQLSVVRFVADQYGGSHALRSLNADSENATFRLGVIVDAIHPYTTTTLRVEDLSVAGVRGQICFRGRPTRAPTCAQGRSIRRLRIFPGSRPTRRRTRVCCSSWRPGWKWVRRLVVAPGSDGDSRFSTLR